MIGVARAWLDVLSESVKRSRASALPPSICAGWERPRPRSRACTATSIWAPLLLLLATHASAGVLERALMPGPVIQAHQKYEAECERCHSSFAKEQQSQLCQDCHKEIAKDIAAKTGFHGRQSSARCADCHGDHLGLDAQIVKLDESSFDHAKTDFTLAGKHVGGDCKGCHVEGKKHRDAPHDCNGCHAKDDKHAARLGSNCGECHVADDWKKVDKFDHSRTEFKLAGGHAKLECKQCHVESATAKRLPQACVSCHRDDDPHQGAMGSDCAECHVDSDWKTARFDHSKTGFVLQGKHRDTECGGCHKVKGQYTGAPKTCDGCHRDDDQHRTTLGERCETCHDSAHWKPAPKFDHARSKFPLLGGHVKAACSGCHADAAHFADTAQECVDCHRKDDSHKGRNGAKCADCHDTKDWKTSLFDHDKATKFVLRGAHRQAKCDTCHTQPVETFKPGSKCVDCHAKDDVHKTRLGSDCAGCHQEQDWKKSIYVHDSGRFPLIGGHRVLECKQCHQTQLFADTQRECVGCHRKDDPHAGRFGDDCAQCHNARDWHLWDFDHSRTAFALTGAHQRTRCAACHTPAAGRQLSAECGTCHAQDDAHEGGFGRQCARCHTTTSFAEVAPRVTGKSP